MASCRGRHLVAGRILMGVLLGILSAGIPAHSTQTAVQLNVGNDQEQVCTKLMDVFLVVDESGSIGWTNYEKVRQFVRDFILSLPVGPDDVHVGLMTFSSYVNLRWTLKDAEATNKEAAAAKAASLSYAQGGTQTHEALAKVADLLYDTSKGARGNVPKLVLLMTDGQSFYPDSTLSAASRLRQKGSVIVVLGVGSGVKVSECRGVAGCERVGQCDNYIQTEWSRVMEQVSKIMVAACIDLPKDAICSPWSDYGPCTGDCGKKGVRKSTRTEVSPARPGTPQCASCVAPQGRSCAEQPPGLERTEPCQMPECKVDAGCGEFGPWSAWSSTCGTATRRRRRTSYNNPPPTGGGLWCAEQRPPKLESETETIQKVPCPVQQKPGPWGEWTACSATCGGGKQTRTREGIPQEGELYGGQNLEQQGIPVKEERACGEQPCPVDATCGKWGEWTACSKTCGGGSQTRERSPWLNNAQHGGRTCEQQHPEGKEQLRTCNTDNCPIDEVPGEWEEWSPCSEQCGPGTQTRTRGESKQKAMYGGKTIEEQNADLPDDKKIETTQTRPCENNPCGPCTLPWTDWTDCPKCPGARARETMVIFDYYNGPCELPTNEAESCEGYCPAGGGEKEEGAGGNAAAIAGGIVGGLVVLGAAGGGAAYSMGGGGQVQESGDMVEIEGEDPATNIVEEEKEALISPGDQAEMWAA